MLRIEPRLALSKASDLPAVLWLLVQVENFKHRTHILSRVSPWDTAEQTLVTDPRV